MLERNGYQQFLTLTSILLFSTTVATCSVVYTHNRENVPDISGNRALDTFIYLSRSGMTITANDIKRFFSINYLAPIKEKQIELTLDEKRMLSSYGVTLSDQKLNCHTSDRVIYAGRGQEVLQSAFSVLYGRDRTEEYARIIQGFTYDFSDNFKGYYRLDLNNRNVKEEDKKTVLQLMKDCK